MRWLEKYILIIIINDIARENTHNVAMFIRNTYPPNTLKKIRKSLAAFSKNAAN